MTEDLTLEPVTREKLKNFLMINHNLSEIVVERLIRDNKEALNEGIRFLSYTHYVADRMLSCHMHRCDDNCKFDESEPGYYHG